MRLRRPKLLLLSSAAMLAGAGVYVSAGHGSARREAPAGAPAISAEVIPLKDAKLNIEHNATDEDTGFQGFVDSEGWRRLDVRGPDGRVLTFQGRGSLGRLGLTELFSETVEPANADVPIEEMLAKLPEVVRNRRSYDGERRARRSHGGNRVAHA